jgi:four helix bundle protein
MAFKFEKLIAWQKALDLGLVLHDLTLTFPVEEKYVLASQIKRAGDSITLNIAEGSTGQSNKEFSKFLGYALRFSVEVIAALHIALKRKLIGHTQFERVYQQSEEVFKITQGLRNSIDVKK